MAILLNLVKKRCITFGVPACPAVPVTSGHLQCTDTFAWSRVCPFMTGTTVCTERTVQEVGLLSRDYAHTAYINQFK